jgi:acylphosphatase
MPTEPIRRRLVVRGNVQGVFFRDSMRERAEGTGVGGWVRNCADGSVKALLEGEREAVEALIDFAREGPAWADVREVGVQDETPEGLSGFDVR